MSVMGDHGSDTTDQVTMEQDRSVLPHSPLLPNDLLDNAGSDESSAAGVNVTFNLIDASQPQPDGDGVRFDQEGVTLSFDDVLSIGTESIGDLQALVVTGDQGDLVRLKSDPDHNWQIAETIAAPDGFTAYQAVGNTFENHAGEGHASHDPAGSHEIYVLVQHDLQVMLNIDSGELS